MGCQEIIIWMAHGPWTMDRLNKRYGWPMDQRFPTGNLEKFYYFQHQIF